jgi:hypothetical protein
LLNRRTLLLLLLLLAGGASVSVCMAITCAYFKGASNQASLLFDASDEDKSYWEASKPPGFVQDVVVRAEARTFGHHAITLLGDCGGLVHRSDNTLGIDGSWPPPRWEACSISAFGWPASMVQSSAWSMTTGRKPSKEDRSYRLRPGFAINTLFYAAILWALFAAPFALQRRSRIRRGLCPACAYPVGESPICTECGAPFPSPIGRGVRGEGGYERR